LIISMYCTDYRTAHTATAKSLATLHQMGITHSVGLAICPALLCDKALMCDQKAEHCDVHTAVTR
jgi:hypothetical protein